MLSLLEEVTCDEKIFLGKRRRKRGPFLSLGRGVARSSLSLLCSRAVLLFFSSSLPSPMQVVTVEVSAVSPSSSSNEDPFEFDSDATLTKVLPISLLSSPHFSLHICSGNGGAAAAAAASASGELEVSPFSRVWLL